MDQSNISEKNIERLKVLDSIEDSAIQKLRVLILEIAVVAPRKRRRWKNLAANQQDLLKLAIEMGLCDDFKESESADDLDPHEPYQMSDWDAFQSFDTLFASRDSDDFDEELTESDISFLSGQHGNESPVVVERWSQSFIEYSG